MSAAIPSGRSAAHGEAWTMPAAAALTADEVQTAQTTQAGQPEGAFSNALGPTYDGGRASPYSAASSDLFDQGPAATVSDASAASAAQVSSIMDDANQALDDLSEAVAAEHDHGDMTDCRTDGVDAVPMGALHSCDTETHMLPCGTCCGHQRRIDS